MWIYLNEQPLDVGAGTRLHALRDDFKPTADVLIVNGFPAAVDQTLADGDNVVLIRRGEIPATEELETLMAARHTSADTPASQVGRSGLPTAVASARRWR